MARDFGIDQKPDEILRMMEENIAGNENYLVVGTGWLTYKAGELNSQATKRLTAATYVLAFFALVQVIALFIQILFMSYPPHP